MRKKFHLARQLSRENHLFLLQVRAVEGGSVVPGAQAVLLAAQCAWSILISN